MIRLKKEFTAFFSHDVQKKCIIAKKLKVYGKISN